jgi:hypothetical protein
VISEVLAATTQSTTVDWLADHDVTVDGFL